MDVLKFIRYFEHKTDSYKNGLRKLYTHYNSLLFMEVPYQDGNSYGFKFGDPKEVDEETLSKYFKEIPRREFFAKQITHIPAC